MLINNSLDLQINLTPSDEPPTTILYTNSRPKGEADIQQASDMMHTTLCQRIENKIIKKGKPRRKPLVTPTILVVFANHDLDADLERVIHEFFRHPPIDVSSHFAEVWLSKENVLVKLD